MGTAEIDREIACRAAQLNELSIALVGLDDHAGREHLRRYAPVGATARRWTELAPLVDRLWDDLASATAHTQLPAAQFRAVLDRMQANVEELQDFLNGVDEVNSHVAAGVAPLLTRLDDAGAPMPSALTDLLTVAATDPVSLTAEDVQQRVAVLTDDVDRQCSALAELKTLRDNWPASVSSTRDKLAALGAATAHADLTRARAEREVATGPIPEPADDETALRELLDALTEPDPDALLELRGRIDRTMQTVLHGEALAQGLLARRDELYGRLRAYEAKAARLGLAEDPEVLSSKRIASGLLSHRPCDLAALTRAVAAYQQMVARKRRESP